MNENLKVQSHHFERAAYFYIRQSSMRQVMENVESPKRQYYLRGRAVGLGWRDDQIIVIDSDKGEFGALASWRERFQKPLSDVGIDVRRRGHQFIFHKFLSISHVLLEMKPS